MQYKKLIDTDFTVGYGAIIAPMGASNKGILLEDIEYQTGTAALGSRTYGQFANIIQGDQTSALPVGNSFHYTTINRNIFRNSINVATFEYNGNQVDRESPRVCEAGMYYGGSGFYLYPDIGVILASSAPTKIVCHSERIDTTCHIHIRARSSEFNYSTNPSFSDTEGNPRFYEWVNNPVTFITTIGLYNDNGDLLAVAKVDPTKKTFHDDILFKLQLDF